MEISPLPSIFAQKSSWICSPCSLFSVNQDRLVVFSHCHYHLFIRKSQIQKSITCARNRRRQYGSARSTKLMLESAYYIASKLKILPEPLDLLIKEFCNGGRNGGGYGFWKGSGWGGFDGWGRRRRKRKVEFLGILVILCLVIWLIVGKELNTDVFLGVLGLLLFGLSVCGWRRAAFKDWALGFSCCAVLVGLALKKEDFQRWMKNFGAMKVSFRSRKRRAF